MLNFFCKAISVFQGIDIRALTVTVLFFFFTYDRFLPVPAVRSPLIRRPRRAICLGSVRTRVRRYETLLYMVCTSYANHAHFCFHVRTDVLKLKRLFRSEWNRNVDLFGPAFRYVSAGACSGNLNRVRFLKLNCDKTDNYEP